MTTRSWDIFCSVVDNYGDVGVCWRLARQVAAEPKPTIRLWLDELARLHSLCHAVDTERATQHVHSVQIRQWDSKNTVPWAETETADIVIEGFGVRLPPDYVAAMAQRARAPVWINLEYLSAESWVASHHALPSPQPDGVLTKYFFFPGFTTDTGGLLIEGGLSDKRARFQADGTAIATFRRSLGERAETLPADALWISLFCYDNAALPMLVAAWTHSPAPIVCVVPEGATQNLLATILGPGLTAGALTMLPIPFLEQDAYDRLLWSCDLNFVRGEDSFVRAQLAARPLVWQAYPQAENAHLDKVTAFSGLYTAGLEQGVATKVSNMFDLWNRQASSVAPAWQTYIAARPALLRHAAIWAERLGNGPKLAESLAQFCENQLK